MVVFVCFQHLFIFTVKPSPPFNLSHIQTVEAELILSWKEPLDFNDHLLRYEVRYSSKKNSLHWQVGTRQVESGCACGWMYICHHILFIFSRWCLHLKSPIYRWIWNPYWGTPSRSAVPPKHNLHCGATGAILTTFTFAVRTVYLFLWRTAAFLKTFRSIDRPWTFSAVDLLTTTNQ